MKPADILQTLRDVDEFLDAEPKLRRGVTAAIQIVSQHDQRTRRLKALLSRQREALGELQQLIEVQDVEDLPPEENELVASARQFCADRAGRVLLRGPRITETFGPCWQCSGHGALSAGSSTARTIECARCSGSGQIVTSRTVEEP